MLLIIFLVFSLEFLNSLYACVIIAKTEMVFNLHAFHLTFCEE